MANTPVIQTLPSNYYTCYWCVLIVGPGAMANCRPLRCSDCRTKATWVAASAAASCFTIT